MGRKSKTERRLEKSKAAKKSAASAVSAAAAAVSVAANDDDTNTNANDMDAPPPPVVAHSSTDAGANSNLDDTNANANDTTDTRPPRAVANSTSIPEAVANVPTDDHPPPAVAASASNFDFHNDACERCGLWGEVVCCGNCSLVFHLSCTRPKLNSILKEEDKWRCAFCISEYPDVSEEERRLANQHKCEIVLQKNEALKKRRGNATDESASKRPRSG